MARSRFCRNRNSAGVSSMKVVVASPDLNVGCSIRFSRNEMFVLTPRMRNSPQRAVGALPRLFERRAPRGDLHEQRIEVRRDHRAAEAVAAVEADGEPARRTIGRDAAVVGREVTLRILGRDPALHRDAAVLDLLLRRDVERRLVQPVSVRDQDLAAHQVDAGHHLGHRVLDLDARVHFDEVELVAIDVEQELDGAGAAIADRSAQRRGRFADPAAAAPRAD